MWKAIATWGLLIAMVVIALSGCGQRLPTYVQFASSLGYCDQNSQLGRFDIKLTDASSKYPGYYELVIDTVDDLQDGTEIEVALVNPSQNYKVLVPATQLQKGKQLSDSFISKIDLQNFQTVVIEPFNGGATTPVDNRDPRATLCQLPTVDPVNGQTAGGVPGPGA
jgi:hypothetical protein